MSKFFWLTLAIAIGLTACSEVAAESPPLRVAVVDTGLDLDDPRFAHLLCKDGRHWDFVTNRPMQRDSHGHGTHVAGLIKQYAGNANYCLLIYSYYAEGYGNLSAEIKALRRAVEDRADVVNISGGGDDFDEAELLIIQSAPRTTFVASAGNEKRDIDRVENYYYPGSYRLKNVINVGALGSGKSGRLDSSNFGKSIKAWEAGEDIYSTLPHNRNGYMSGTSQATAIHTGKLVNSKVGRRRAQ